MGEKFGEREARRGSGVILGAIGDQPPPEAISGRRQVVVEVVVCDRCNFRPLQTLKLGGEIERLGIEVVKIESLAFTHIKRGLTLLSAYCTIFMSLTADFKRTRSGIGPLLLGH